MSEPSPTVQPCNMAWWPTETWAPMVSGKPGSVCMTAPSCTLLPTPMLMVSLSPRRVAPNHTLLCSASIALPMTEALGATYALGAPIGETSPNLYKAINSPTSQGSSLDGGRPSRLLLLSVHHEWDSNE